jgi:shikimate dehydrogenase
MTDKYAVIGHPVSHSKSPLIHRMFAEQTGQNMSYEAIEAPLDGFANIVQRLRDEGYKGCNITVPFKHEAFKLANEHSLSAKAAHAVNTILFHDGIILGDNTDGVGLVTDIEQNLKYKLRLKHVLLMGAGGAAYGVIWPLFNAGASIVITNRNMDKADKLALEFKNHATVSAKSYASLAGHRFDMLINATSSGLTDSLPPLPDGLFNSGALAYDMMYGKHTPFLRFASEQGASQIADGLGMLVEQAAVAFEKWRGVHPDTAPVMAKLRT